MILTDSTRFPRFIRGAHVATAQLSHSGKGGTVCPAGCATRLGRTEVQTRLDVVVSADSRWAT